MQPIKPEAGMRLGNYTLAVKLGKGIFGETWLAEHMHLEGKEICVKIFTDQKFCHNLVKQKFLPVVRDPFYLPTVEDCDPSNNPPYMVQEMVSGRSVRQLLRERKRLPANLALTILENIIKALQKLHEKKVAHLDLRPEHIMLNDENKVRLLDYSLGKVTTSTVAEYFKEYAAKKVSSLPKAIMRSLVYKSKRQRTGYQFDLQADIFALGILLFEMVTGAYPSRKAAFPSELDESLPATIDQIYAQCCGKGEGAYQNIDQLLHSIRGELVQETVAPLQEEDKIPTRAAAEPPLLPGIQVLDETAQISVTTMAGDKKFVDGNNISLLTKNLDEIIASKLRFIAFDFSGIDYLSSSAIGFLVNFNDRVQSMEGAMVMFQVHKKVITILGALGLENIFKIVDSPEEAQKYLLAARQEVSQKR